MPNGPERWKRKFPQASNTGLITKNTPTFDCDICDRDAAAAIEKLAKQRFGRRGRFMMRTGMAPKFAVPFRADTPFEKIVIKLVPPGVSDAEIKKNPKLLQGLEFLGDGQQFVAFGIHPDTRKPYHWNGGGEPGKVKHSALPHINAAEARQLVDDAAALLVEQFGYRRRAQDERDQEECARRCERVAGTQYPGAGQSGKMGAEHFRRRSPTMVTASAWLRRPLAAATMRTSPSRQRASWTLVCTTWTTHARVKRTPIEIVMEWVCGASPEELAEYKYTPKFEKAVEWLRERLPQLDAHREKQKRILQPLTEAIARRCAQVRAMAAASRNATEAITGPCLGLASRTVQPRRLSRHRGRRGGAGCAGTDERRIGGPGNRHDR